MELESALDESRSWPNGFSTITRFHPVCVIVARLCKIRWAKER